MSIPEPPDDATAHLLQAVYDLTVQFGRWPLFRELDKYLHQRDLPDAADRIQATPPGLLWGVDALFLQADQEVALTAAGMRACVGTREDLEAFLGVVRYAVDLEAALGVSDPQPILTMAEVAHHVPLPAAGRKALLGRVALLLRVERWGSSGSTQTPEGECSFTIAPQVRRLHGIETLEDYWRCAHPNPVAEQLGLDPWMVKIIEALSAHPSGVGTITEAGLSLKHMSTVKAFKALVKRELLHVEHFQLQASDEIGLVEDVSLTSGGFEVASRLRETDRSQPPYEAAQIGSAGRPPSGPDTIDRPSEAFIVHGRDPRQFREAVARLVSEATDLTPIILDEQLDKGMTLIDKFQTHAGPDCVAIILMTGDDEGRLRDQGDVLLRRRPRQNVVFELGYFVALLPPERIIVLREDDLEGPGDLAGVVYVPLDSDDWKLRLCKQLHGLGVEVAFDKL